ncbi:histone-fold-containing protein [Dendryphion nanum]|uniref:DNA polymerase epsilon subunit D n=1 Tax=Dendryphion nanum TaxID=256645 RepID=A0A9P9D895_9PLEO|nr:histone-fold-containing protein [Dendryphion nanum]
MPARKSNVSAVSPEESSKSVTKEDGLSVEDLNLPKSMVQRLAKGVLPPNTQIQKDALLAMSKSATVFVNYLTSYAADMAARSGKKTVMPKDIFDSLQELEFNGFVPRLEAEVDKFTSIRATKRNSYRKKIREEKKAGTGKDDSETSSRAINGNGADDDSPPTKRAKRSSADNGDNASASEDEGDVDETLDDVDQEDEEVEDDEVEEEVAEEGLTEDPIEERENEPSDDDMVDGDESD